jgi:hypothetical protein
MVIVQMVMTVGVHSRTLSVQNLYDSLPAAVMDAIKPVFRDLLV